MADYSIPVVCEELIFHPLLECYCGTAARRCAQQMLRLQVLASPPFHLGAGSLFDRHPNLSQRPDRRQIRRFLFLTLVCVFRGNGRKTLACGDGSL